METASGNMCRCCASEGVFKDLATTYHWMGEEEIYGDMLRECFDIQLSSMENADGGICEVCITQLRNASNFKKQVLLTEEQFKSHLQNVFKPGIVKVEVTRDEGNSTDDNATDDGMSGPEFDDIPIKIEGTTKNEKEDLEIKPKKRSSVKPSTSTAKKSVSSDDEPLKKQSSSFDGNYYDELDDYLEDDTDLNNIVIENVVSERVESIKEEVNPFDAQEFESKDITLRRSSRKRKIKRDQDFCDENYLLQPRFAIDRDALLTETAPKKRDRNAKKSNSRDAKQKLLLNRGKQHQSRSGKIQPARCMKPACEKCRFNCNLKLDYKQRKLIFDYFWNLGNHERQWTFIGKCSRRCEKRTNTTSLNSKRQFSVYYFLTGKNGLPVKVCRTMFQNTLNVSSQFVSTAIEKYNTATGKCEKDGRGQNKNKSKFNTEAMKRSIWKHMCVLGLVETQGEDKLCLIGDLKLSKLFKLYEIWAEQNKVEDRVPTPRLYRDIINREMKVTRLLY